MKCQPEHIQSIIIIIIIIVLNNNNNIVITNNCSHSGQTGSHTAIHSRVSEVRRKGAL